MEESLYFCLLRISVAQIIKAAGFDKCKPSTLNTLTDIYIQYLKLILKECLKFSDNRINSNQIEVQDVLQGLLSVGFIKPFSFESYTSFNDVPKYANLKDKNSNLLKNYNTKSIESFIEWLKYSDAFRVSKGLSEVAPDLIKSLIEKRKIDTDDTNEAEKRKRKYKEKQDYYNHFKLNDNGDSDGELDDNANEILQKAGQFGWLNYLIEKDLKLGHDFTFANSTLFKEFMKFQSNSDFHPNSGSNLQVEDFKEHLLNINKNDHTVLNIDEEEEEESIHPSTELMQLLPYNLKYDRCFLEDDLEEYIKYKKSKEDLQPDKLVGEEFNDENIIIDDEGIGGDNNLMFL